MLRFCHLSASEHNKYRFGFNGMEKDDEVNGSNGTSYTTPFRQLDPRLGGRWWSRDPPLAQVLSAASLVWHVIQSVCN